MVLAGCWGSVTQHVDPDDRIVYFATLVQAWANVADSYIEHVPHPYGIGLAL